MDFEEGSFLMGNRSRETSRDKEGMTSEDYTSQT